VSSCLDRSLATWICIQFVWEESLPIFANGYRVGNKSSDICTWRIGEIKIYQPCTAFWIRRIDGITVIIV